MSDPSTFIDAYGTVIHGTLNSPCNYDIHCNNTLNCLSNISEKPRCQYLPNFPYKTVSKYTVHDKNCHMKLPSGTKVNLPNSICKDTPNYVDNCSQCKVYYDEITGELHYFRIDKEGNIIECDRDCFSNKSERWADNEWKQWSTTPTYFTELI